MTDKCCGTCTQLLDYEGPEGKDHGFCWWTSGNIIPFWFKQGHFVHKSDGKDCLCYMPKSK